MKRPKPMYWVLVDDIPMYRTSNRQVDGKKHAEEMVEIYRKINPKSIVRVEKIKS